MLGVIVPDEVEGGGGVEALGFQHVQAGLGALGLRIGKRRAVAFIGHGEQQHQTECDGETGEHAEEGEGFHESLLEAVVGAEGLGAFLRDAEFVGGQALGGGDVVER